MAWATRRQHHGAPCQRRFALSIARKASHATEGPDGRRPEFLAARQPILDLTGNTVAYELLFRASAMGGAGVSDDRTATATVISHAFSELGLASVLGACRGTAAGARPG